MADRATYDDMKAAAELTGIPVSRLYDQGARLRLDQIRADAARLESEATQKLREKRRGAPGTPAIGTRVTIEQPSAHAGGKGRVVKVTDHGAKLGEWRYSVDVALDGGKVVSVRGPEVREKRKVIR
jgi:hypothetical protein